MVVLDGDSSEMERGLTGEIWRKRAASGF